MLIADSRVMSLPMKRGAEGRPKADKLQLRPFKVIYHVIVVIIIHSLYPVFQFCRFVWSYGYNLAILPIGSYYWLGGGGGVDASPHTPPLATALIIKLSFAMRNQKI